MEQIIPPSDVGPSTEELLAMNIMENKIKNAIRTALFNKISTHNPQLAKAIAYRSTHPHLFSSGDLASFYDNYGSYKKELQTYLASIKVEINNYGYEIDCIHDFLLNYPEYLYTNGPICVW